jgi:ribosomal protein L40E
MMFCRSCGSQISDDALFCQKCGTRTEKGAASGVASPSEELRDGFIRIGNELDKAFSIAGKEIREAFKTTGQNFAESTDKRTLVCPQCSEKNFSDASFCAKCGKKLA